jgi:drug/metabolite transporter (DMT)-like permease
VPTDGQRRELAHHKARIRLVGLTALLAVGVAGMVLFALQHSWITAAVFAVIVVPILIAVLAARTRQHRERLSL